MKSRKSAAPPSKPESRPRGTDWAKTTRAACNQLSDAQRQALLDRALRLAYASDAPAPAPTPARRR